MALKTLKVTSFSCTHNLNSPFYTSIKALPIAKNGLLSMMGISLSSSISRMMNSTKKINLSTFNNTSSTMPRG